MNSIWNKNLSAFKKRFPALAELYSQNTYFLSQSLNSTTKENFISQFESLFPFWHLEQARTGDWTVSENGIWLHSKYRPSYGVPQFKDGTDVCVFEGCGLGYDLIGFCRTKPSSGIILLEPDPLHFFAALCILDWTPVFETEKLIIALNCPLDQIIPLCATFAPSKDSCRIDYSLNPAFVKHDEEYFGFVKKLLDRNISKDQINRNTLKKFGKLWERNARRNASYAKDCAGVEKYKNAFSNSNKPWLLLAAGPSLETVLPDLKKYSQTHILICVDTALRACLKAEVEPDFIVLTDPQFWAYMHIAGLKSPSSILIADSVSYPAVFRFFCKEIVISSSPLPISEELKKPFEGKGTLESGGSVATVAWSFAVWAGAKEIYTAGLDLSFPARQTHIKGSTFEQNMHKVSNRVISAEKKTSDVIFGADISVSEDYSGNKVLTDSRMKMFAWWFESKVAATPGVKTYSLCKESMKIPGISLAEKKPL